jgi:hypothetical protein
VIEILGLVPVGEPGALQADGAWNLLRVALATRGNLRPATERSPCLMQGWALAEGGFIDKNDHRAFGVGVFFRWG